MLNSAQNLGLGVLEEKRDKDSREDDASDNDHEDHGQANESSESHVMDRLMGIKSRPNEKPPGIHEVEDG